MAIVNDSRIGRTRRKLAQMIAEKFPELKTPYLLGDSQTWVVDPFSLRPQIPVYASAQWDCCKWDANLPLRGYGSYHIYSFDTMGELVKCGFDAVKVDAFEYELSAK